ncbi:hypothetical protein [Embleya sp. NBC_00896]|uniref:hypothetical protein n=1 Tax=Embleya sp. NBC_00896 TaxID=2975961 RepID=UPI0038703494|nr:hypothetical protein OG928_16010 [Embleya sp. NBC_00896]
MGAMHVGESAEPLALAEARARARAVLWVRNGAVLGALTAAGLLLYGASRTLGESVPGTLLAGLAATIVVVLAWVALDLALVRRPGIPAITLSPADARELHEMVRGLAEELDVPVPDGIRLCPECDSWLEPGARRARSTVLVIGAPFLWWLRVGELRALLAPVVAGTEASAEPAVAGARRWVRRLDAVADVRRSLGPVPLRPARRVSRAFARQLLGLCQGHAELMEREIAVGAAALAIPLEPELRAIAHEQVGLAYAGWDRLLTRLAAPAWTIGRRPDALMTGVVSALTELSRRDKLADAFGARLAERAASDLLADAVAMDGEISRLAAGIFADGPTPDPVAWTDYPEAVIEPVWRARAAAFAAPVDDALAVLRRDPDDDHREAADHLFAVVACAALDTGRMHPAVDWLDGPVLVDGRGHAVDLATLITRAVDEGNDTPLRTWLAHIGIPTREPVHPGGSAA